jgi:hypothetical protein
MEKYLEKNVYYDQCPIMEVYDAPYKIKSFNQKVD